MGYAKHALTFAFIALLCACATRDHSRKFMSGSTFERLNSNTVRVSFYEDRPTYRENLEKDLIYSCALITTTDGYDYFTIIGGDLSPTTLRYSRVRVRYQHTLASQYSKRNDAYTSYSTTCYYQIEAPIHDGQSKATAIIQMFKKPRPPKLWYAYDARELMNNLRSPG